MNTVDELVYYCKEYNPVGTLMFTGEWGCGKTYLIEQELKKKLKDSHIIVRISLFGVNNIDGLKMTVKKQWLSQCNTFLNKIQGKEKKAKGIVSGFASGLSLAVPQLKSAKDTILSINLLDYIDIKPCVDDKRVVLVFDDLERSGLNTIDLLGCINEYCENYHFNVIIVANEKRITVEESDKSINYAEIKEKIIERTVYHKPKFEDIIDSILDENKFGNEDYKKFLITNKVLILEVFEIERITIKKDDGEEEEVEFNNYNIRSLKCALQDFYRVYKKLVSYKVLDMEKYFYSFIIYMMMYKAGVTEEGEYGFLFSDTKIKKMFPRFSTSFLLNNIRKWIEYGEWNEELLNEELKIIVKQTHFTESKDILKCHRFIELEEDIIRTGFSGLLKDCYAGNMNLNEYVFFIQNSSLISRYNIELPERINWNKVIDGINICFEKYIKENESENYVLLKITRDSRKNYEGDALKAHDLIADFRKKNVVICENNKKCYIEEIQSKKMDIFKKYQNSIFRAFDGDMAEATLSGFERATQSEKVYLPGDFEGMWEKIVYREEIDFEITKNGFLSLLDGLKKLKSQYEEKGKNISAVHTETFINVINNLINNVEKIENEKRAIK
ncbi:KAP family P-loop domain-containing protein [Eubacterium uniforme]|uniref:KAP family P-loop domain-containing protein n=1 Tax=Eubacterium uniforme TaxID=39495 RepID=A0A1T4VD71_9FIRM|nr:P-loop NTPase fold protein [Eubacterium uniforme]SKA62808.1 KAP family P-loop domain-containing protein [Eubacterium uniforme]